MGVSPHLGFANDLLVRTMLDHGHTGAALEFLTAYNDDPSGFPFSSVWGLMHSHEDSAVRAAVLARAADAWLESPSRRHLLPTSFVHLFTLFWTLLPEGKALAVLHEIVDRARTAPTDRITSSFGSDAPLVLTSVKADMLFRVLHVLRVLEPELANTLLAEDAELAGAARLYPNGLQSLEEEAIARRQDERRRKEREGTPVSIGRMGAGGQMG